MCLCSAAAPGRSLFFPLFPLLVVVLRLNGIEASDAGGLPLFVAMLDPLRCVLVEIIALRGGPIPEQAILPILIAMKLVLPLTLNVRQATLAEMLPAFVCFHPTCHTTHFICLATLVLGLVTPLC